MSLMERLERQKNRDPASAAPQPAEGNHGQVKRQTTGILPMDDYAALKSQMHSEIIDLINRDALNITGEGPEQEAFIRSSIESVVAVRGEDIPRAERGRIVTELYSDIVGLGPLDPLLADPDISEIMVNGPGHVHVEMKGKLHLTDVKFRDDAHVMNVINRIVSSIGRHIDESSPMVDARLADGSRVNAIIPPCALSGPTITIRKFSKTPLTVRGRDAAVRKLPQGAGTKAA